MRRTSESHASARTGPALRSRTFHCMGTAVSLTLPAGVLSGTPGGGAVLDDAAAAVERVFAGLDGTFSLYRPQSEASRMARGELTLRAASADMRARYADAAGWRLLTEGAFTPERPDGVPDLSGIIKGYAIRQAGAALQDVGLGEWCLNAGGDVLVSGSPGSGEPWRAGIVDPEDRLALLSGFSLGGSSRFAALATSGSAERGDHIWTAGAGRSAFRQVSVAAADIVTADVLATAIVAGGRSMLDRATAGWDVEVLAVSGGGELLGTPGFHA